MAPINARKPFQTILSDNTRRDLSNLPKNVDFGPCVQNLWSKNHQILDVEAWHIATQSLGLIVHITQNVTIEEFLKVFKINSWDFSQ